jgi:hypothetical protein
METRDELLVRMAKLLDQLDTSSGLAVRAGHMDRAFGGIDAIAIKGAEVFARVHGCEFEYDPNKRLGMFSRSYPKGGRA